MTRKTTTTEHAIRKIEEIGRYLVAIGQDASFWRKEWRDWSTPGAQTRTTWGDVIDAHSALPSAHYAISKEQYLRNNPALI